MESFQDLVQSPTLVSVELPVLGLPVCFETNDEQLLEVVEEAFGAWRIMEGMPGLLSSRRFRVRFVVREGDEGPEPHASLAYEVPVRGRVVLQTPGSMGVADAAAGHVLAVVTRSLVADRAHFRYGVLEALTLALLTCFDRMPFHAAAIVRGGSALLLAGPTGVGKSTLAYAALRAGFRVLTDDAVYLQMDPALGIWGVPGHLHLPVDAPRHFPELAGATLTLRANGKKKISVDVRAMGGMVERPMIEDAALCLLRRGDGPPAVRAASASEIEATLAARVEPGFDLFADAIGPAVARLAERGGWMLRVGGEPTGVMEVVRSVFDDFQRA
jgi:hypothetical protein